MQFVHLTKDSEDLNKILVGQNKPRRLLSNTLASEELGRMRNEVYDRLLKDLTEDAAPPIQADNGLGLDGPVGEAASPPKLPARLRTSIRSQIPATLVVEATMPDGSSWRPVLLSNRMQLWMEATADNFQALFTWVQMDQASGSVKRPRFGSHRKPEEIKEPRVLEDGSREYWDGKRKRWIKKQPVVTDDILNPSLKKKFKTLVRRASDEAASSSRGRCRGASRLAKPQPELAPIADVAAAAVETDPLGLPF
jgi:hypothetical protein